MDYLEFNQTLRMVHGAILLTGLYAGLGYVWWLKHHTAKTSHASHSKAPGHA